MAFKPRWESEEFKILGFLNTRMILAVVDKHYYLNLKKGVEGEVMFDLLTEKLQSDCLILNDLLLKVNNTTFQIDTLIIQETLQLFEVKNYEGDYYYESDNFYSKTATEILNPLDQSKRCECLLRQLLQKHGYNFPIEARVVFINPAFTLYQAPKNKPIIYPTQLDHLIKNLDMEPSKLNGRHKKLAELLVSLHIEKSAYSQLPTYSYDRLKKGMTCGVCNSFSISVGGKKIVCDACGCEEDVESAVMRSVGEIKLLFPDRKITTNCVHEWCGVVEKKRISRILGRNFKIVGVHQWTFYE